MLQTRLDEYFNHLISINRIPGCGLIVRRHGRVIYQKCFGLSDIENHTPMTEDTLFRIASMSKLITAVSVMKLVEQEKLSLDDGMLKFFPQWPAEKNKVTIRHLLNHSSALGQLAASNEYAMQVFDIRDSLAERVDHKWAQMPLDCEPGETAEYSALVSFDILSRIIEIVTGTNPDSWMKENIFLPLGMKDSGFFLTLEQKARIAPSYASVDGKLILQSADNPMFDNVTTRYGYTSGAAGMFSTLHDYDRFTTMLSSGGIFNGVRILSEESLELMRTPNQITDLECVPGCPWGLGFMIFRQPEKAGIMVHPDTFGWSGALGTHMFIDPVSDISATYMVSMSDLNGAGSFISRNIEKIIYEEES